MRLAPYFDILLPYPPSLNTGWRCVAGIIKLAKRQRLFRKAVAGRVRELLADKDTPYRVMGLRKCAVDITVYPPTKRRYDLDNLAKPILDALMHAGVMEDDSQVQFLELRKGEVDKPTGSCFVIVQALGEGE